MPLIHPSAVIEDGAELAPDVAVGAFAYIGPRVKLGPRCVVHHHASVEGDTVAGANNAFFPHAVVGCEPQDLKYRGGNCKLVIGSDNIFREHVTIHIGTEEGGGYTRVGDDNLIMIGSHIAHDCIVGSHCILANNVLLAGHVELQDYVVISGAAGVAHYCTIWQHAFIGGLSGVQRDVPPFMIVDGHPIAVRGVNRNGLKRRGFTDEQMDALKTAYKLLFSDATPALAQVPELKKLYPESKEIALLLSFLESIGRGKYGRYRESLRGRAQWSEEDENNTHPISGK